MSKPSRRDILVGLPATCVVAAVWPRVAWGASEFDGAFVLVDPEKQRKKVEQKIDELADDMNALMRSMARSRLKQTVVPAPAMKIAVGDSHIVISIPGVPLKKAPANGSKVPWTSKHGDRVSLSMFMKDGDLHERFRGKGNRDNVYRLSSDGQRIDLSVRIFANVFPHPLRFNLPYKRV